MKTPLLDFRMHDGSRHFAELPEECSWDELRRRMEELPGVEVMSFVTDGITEMWLVFTLLGHEFSVNNQFGDFWFFVRDPSCPDAILLSVVDHCEKFLAR